MKKMFKAALSLLLAAFVFLGTLPPDTVKASAAGSLAISVKYNEKGAAVVTVTPSSPDSLVRYTLTGKEPKISSPVYFEEFTVDKECLLRVAEFASNGTKIAGVKKEIKLKQGKAPAQSTPVVAETTSAPPAEPEQTSAALTITPSAPEFLLSCQQGRTTVTIGCATPGAVIYYTTDGSLPTESSTQYTGALTVKKSTKITAVSAISGGGKSDAIAITADVAAVSTGAAAPAEETAKPAAQADPQPEAPAKTTAKKSDKALNPDPDISAAKGVNATLKYSLTNMDESGGTYVTISGYSRSSTVYYTTDGTAPDKNAGAKKYTKRVMMSEPGYFRAYEYDSKDRIISKLSLKVEPICAAVKMECIEFYELSRIIELTTATEGATIRYTTDGTDPLKSRFAKTYTEPFSIGIYDAIKAVAIKDNCKNSRILAAQAAEAEYRQRFFDFSDPIYREVTDLINTERILLGRQQLVLDENFTRAANVRAEEINAYFSNTRPDSTSFTTALYQAGVEKFSSVAEVYSAGEKTPGEFISRMMTNQKSIVLDGSANRIGVGHFVSENGGHYWIVIVGKVNS